MNKMVSLSATAALFVVSLAASMYAHHGGAWFDMARKVTVSGTVTSVEWTNPHAYIHIDVKGKNGTLEKWSGEMGSLNMLRRSGWGRDTVKMGDVITFTGRPSKDGVLLLHLDSVVTSSGEELSADQPRAAVTVPKE